MLTEVRTSIRLRNGNILTRLSLYSEVLNLGEDIFENVGLPTAILVVDKNKQGSKIADLRTIERSKIENTITTRNFELKENYQTKYSFQDDIKRLEEARAFRSRKTKSLRLAKSNHSSRQRNRQNGLCFIWLE